MAEDTRLLRSAVAASRWRPHRQAARAVAGLVAGIAWLPPSGAALGAPPGDAKAEAAALYREASELVRKGDEEHACPKLAESDRLDPQGATKLALARCYEGTRRPASAWAMYIEAADADKLAGNKQREAEARARAAALEPKLPRLTVVVPDAVKSLPGIEIQRDGAAVQRFGTAEPVDLGEHTISAAARGKRRWEGKVTVGELGDTKEVVVPALEDAAPPPPRAVDAGVLPEPVLLPPAELRNPEDPARRGLMFVTGSLTVAGIALGSVFGGLAISKWHDVKAAAQHGGCRDATAYTGCTLALHEMQFKASSFATISTFSFIVGGAALAGTTLLWLTTPARDVPRAARVELAPLVGPTAAGGVVKGVF